MRRIKGIHWATMLVSATMLFSLAGCGNDKPVYVSTQRVGETFLDPAMLEKVGLQYYWKTQRSLSLGSGEKVTGFWALEENLYFLTNHKNLYAMDATVGTMKWVVSVTSVRSAKVFAPTHVAGVRMPDKPGTASEILSPTPLGNYEPFNAVVINTCNRVLVIDRKKGTVVRDIPFKGFMATTQGVSDGTQFYVGASGGLCIAIDLVHAVRSWHFDIEGSAKAPLQLYMGRLYIATLSGKLFLLDADPVGARQWTRIFDAPISKPFLVNENGIFITCDDERVYALDPADGKTRWEPIEMPGMATTPPQAGPGTLYQCVTGKGLYAINIRTGTVQWKAPAAQKILTTIDDVDYLLGPNQTLLLTDPSTGKTNESLTLQGFDFVAAPMGASAIFTATRSGKAFCIRPKDAGRLTLDMLE